MSAPALAALIRDRQVSVREVMQTHLRRLDAVNAALNAIMIRLDERRSPSPAPQIAPSPAAAAVPLHLEATMTLSKRPANRVVGVGAAVAAASAASMLYARWIRRRLLTWGASSDEVTRAWPGDELIPGANAPDCTMATTLPAPPEQVWPWLVQMGVGRAGWYSWDRLDNGGKPSADRIVPEWQSLQVGQRLHVSPDGQKWMTVAMAEPNRALVLRATAELPSGRSFDPRPADLPRAYLDGIWGFYLQPAPGGMTRLVVHTRGQNHLGLLGGPFSLLLGEPAHFFMQTRQFHGLRTRVSAQADGGAG